MDLYQNSFQVTVIELEQRFHIAFGDKPVSAAQQSLHDRLRRSLSWLKRAAEVSEKDHPPRFLDLWISLNALYAIPRYSSKVYPDARRAPKDVELEDFLTFLDDLSKLESGYGQLGRLTQDKNFMQHTRSLISNPYLRNEFWEERFAKFKDRRAKDLADYQSAIMTGSIERILVHWFRRLRILRNQIAHGCASATTKRNRDALYSSVLLLENFLLMVINLLIEQGPGCVWPRKVSYPGSGSYQAINHDRYLGKSGKHI